jgi:hypothetical protein
MNTRGESGGVGTMETRIARVRVDARKVGCLVAFGVSEYTLVFRRALSAIDEVGAAWMVMRPSAHGAMDVHPAQRCTVSTLFVTPIYSTLALDSLTYERFLWQSGALDSSLALLTSLDLDQPEVAETARRMIASLVIAAEVQHIVDGMSA